jgi:hypothetical protein
VGVGCALYDATCALAASTGSACADATASIVSNLGAVDGSAGNAAYILLGATAAPGGVCTATTPGSPAHTARVIHLWSLLGPLRWRRWTVPLRFSRG